MKSTKRKRERYAIVSILLLLISVILTYLICNWTGEDYYDSWASSLGEVIVSGALMTLQGYFIQQISTLIKEADLDLIPVSGTFCANLSVVGFIFLVQCGDLGIHIITSIFMDKT